MNEEKMYNWKEVIISICGQKITGIASITFNALEGKSDCQLTKMLKEAEQAEDYEYCAQIRDEINSRNS